jgi:N-acyl-D-amino-acid deacylase
VITSRLAAAALSAAIALAGAGEAERYDLVIRDARIVDGAGGPWFRGDVAVRGGRIARVGRVEASGAAR